MKKSTLIATMAAAFVLTAIPAAAQDNETSYFLDNNLFGYRFNPSTVPYRTSGFFMVGAGNVAATTDMNIGVSNFLFKLNDGKLVNGFNSAVTYDEFITPLPEKIGIGADINENILSIASTGKKGGFRNFEVNLVTKDHFSLDKNLLAALKSNDGSTGTFTAKDITAASQNYLEIAIGGSKRLASFLGIGIRAKGLVGLADVNVNISEMSLTPNTGTGDLLVSGKGTFTAAAKPVNIPVSGGYYNFLGVGRGAIAPAGYGASLDAGATIYMWQDRIQIGAAVHDLGFMQWTTDKYGKMDYTAKAVSTSDGAKGVITDLLQFAPDASKAEETLRTNLPMYYTASVKIKPISIISLGALADIVSDGNGNMTPIMRYGVAFTPFRQLNVAGSYATADGVQNIGLAASLRLLGVSVTAGIDSFITNEGDGFKPMTFMPKYYIPIQPVNTTFNVGVALAFGMSKERWAEVTKVKAKTKKAKTKEKEEELEELEAEEKPMTKAEAKKAAKEQAKADAAAAKAQAEAEAAAAKEQAKADAAAAKAAAKEQAKADKKAAKEAEKQAKKAGKNAVEAAETVAEGAAAATAATAAEATAATSATAATAVSAEQAAAQKAIEEAQAARAAAEAAKAEAEAQLKAIQEQAEAKKAEAEAQAAADAAAQAKAAADAAAAEQAAQEAAAANAQAAIKAAEEAAQAQAAEAAKAAAEAEAAAQAAADKAAAEAAEIAKKVAEEAAAEKAAAEAAEAAAKAAAEAAAQAAPMTEEEARAAAIAQAEAEAKAAEEEAARAAAEAEAALNGTAAPTAPATPAQ